MLRNMETIQKPQKITLKVRKTSKGLFVYTAVDASGTEVYKSQPTHREYVAIMMRRVGAADYRFGRVDLIGKGDSRIAYLTNSFLYLAVTEEVAPLVFIPEKQEQKTFEMRGRQLSAMDSAEAKRKFKKYYGMFGAWWTLSG